MIETIFYVLKTYYSTTYRTMLPIWDHRIRGLDQLGDVFFPPQISQPMHVIVPTTIAQIDAAQESKRLVDNQGLLVVWPHGHGCGRVSGMPHDSDVHVFALLLKDTLTAAAHQAEGELQLLEEQNVHFDSLLCLFVQRLVQPISEVVCRTLEVQLWRHPPVGYEDFLLGAFYGMVYALEIVLGVYEPSTQLLGSDWRERAVWQRTPKKFTFKVMNY